LPPDIEVREILISADNRIGRDLFLADIGSPTFTIANQQALPRALAS
jgi:hypothetical protein